MESMSSKCNPRNSHKQRVKVNIGGKVFETTNSTLQSTIQVEGQVEGEGIFIDRDPKTFSSILSILRTHKYNNNHNQHQVFKESQWYGLNLSQFLTPPPFRPFDASFVSSLIPSSSPIVSAFSSSDDTSTSTSIFVAHSGQISLYHPLTLAFQSSFRTHVDHISSLASFSISSPHLFGFASYSSPGLHLYNLNGSHVHTVFWFDHSDTRLHKSLVTAVADSGPVFSAAYNSHHGENALLLIDKETLKVVSEIARQSGNSAKSSSITKIRWVPTLGLLVGSSVNSGAFGYSAYVRVWDPRSGEMVWETNEPGTNTTRLGDTMADVDVDPQALFLAKIGSRSGDLGVADLRKLGPDPWLYLNDPNPVFSGTWKPSSNVVLHCYQGNVFLGRDAHLEAWSTMEEDPHHRTWPLYRRNFIDKLQDSYRGIITNIQGAGNRLFLTRDNGQGVEVWETNTSSSALNTLA